MLVVVSPAKTLDFESPAPAARATQPRMLDDSERLVDRMRELSPAEIASLMKVSDKIAHLNADRFAGWKRPFNKDNAKPAAFAFKGDVYTGLDIESFGEDELKGAQKRLRILSGLYGVLRPLDLMQPYRLEMGTRLENSEGKDLYSFWGDRITKKLNKDLLEEGSGVLVNLASNEYFRSVKPGKLDARIITPVFQDEKNGQYKVISFYAKKARGLMAAWIIRNNPEKPADLKKFAEQGYRYSPDDSTEDKPVFKRAE
jgi:cytoplasmic iron level regulating protein YaaA (DUF328/UPF0246 family)